jgi:hypothetical protein
MAEPSDVCSKLDVGVSLGLPGLFGSWTPAPPTESHATRQKDHPARLEISNNATAERPPYLTRLPLVPDYIPPQHRTIFRFAVRQREEFH